jgi:hypothetical protein
MCFAGLLDQKFRLRRSPSSPVLLLVDSRWLCVDPILSRYRQLSLTVDRSYQAAIANLVVVKRF